MLQYRNKKDTRFYTYGVDSYDRITERKGEGRDEHAETRMRAAVLHRFCADAACFVCCGEHCPVCEMIAMTTALMRSFCLIAAVMLLRSVFTAARSAFHAPETGYGHSAGTPVSRKIRMND